MAVGYDVVGYDIEEHVYGDMRYPAKLVLADVLALHGAQFKDAALIVASPPCQAYSYMAMPWSLAKAKAAAIRADTTGEKLSDLNRLFHACFRIQREASEAAGRRIPLVVENVRGAQPWVGRAQGNFGSFYLWGDVPADLPKAVKAVKVPSEEGRRTDPGNGARFTSRDCGIEADGLKVPGFRFDGSKKSFQEASREASGLKQPGIGGVRSNGKGDAWFQDGAAKHGSKSGNRKMASAMIAKIPLKLSSHIGMAYWPAAAAQYLEMLS